jgi:hypothetical protein
MAMEYGAFESNPAMWNDNEAWVLQHDNVWWEMNLGEVVDNAWLLSKGEFDETYGVLPSLPKAAFQN